MKFGRREQELNPCSLAYSTTILTRRIFANIKLIYDNKLLDDTVPI